MPKCSRSIQKRTDRVYKKNLFYVLLIMPDKQLTIQLSIYFQQTKNRHSHAYNPIETVFSYLQTHTNIYRRVFFFIKMERIIWPNSMELLKHNK